MAEQRQVTDFSRSYCYYVPNGYSIWVRIQAECVCEVIDVASGDIDTYVLGVRTQTGLRTEPADDALDPGYDFWMTFSKDHIFVRRNHASSLVNNPTKVPVSKFIETGWRLHPASGCPLETPAAVLEALQAGSRIVARSTFAGHDSGQRYRIEYPVKWADGDAVNDAFRVETGPVLLMDPDVVRAGISPEFDDFTWAYLDYHDFEQVRCLIERPTSILYGATYPGSPEAPRRYPPLTDDVVAAIKERLFGEWNAPVDKAALQRLFETNHYSEKQYKTVVTELFALDD